MDVFKVLGEHRAEIIQAWAHKLLNDQSLSYSREPEADLCASLELVTDAFRQVLDGGAWNDLDAFIEHIARRRLAQGFKLSEVQKAFMLYQQVVTPILFKEARDEELAPAILQLDNCISQTVGKFSDFFQGLHEEYISQQTVMLEREVQKRTHELLESERKYKALVEDIRDGYCVVHKGQIVYANEAFCTMHGRTRDKILGVAFLELVAPDSRDRVALSHEQQRNHQAPSPIEYFRRHLDGRLLPTETLGKFSLYEGKPVTLAICRDISERRALEQKTKEAEMLNALAQQAASLAHDIRNPLTAIKMNVQMLAAELKDNPTHHRLVKISQKEVESIERSVVEMMDLARPFRLNLEVVPLRPLIKDCVDALRSRMTLKGVSTSVRLSPVLERLKIDPHRIEQTLVNLLFNAIEAVPRGGRIYVSSKRIEFQGRQWGEIAVADNGPGIPGDLLPYFFDEKRSRRIGLGLDNVKKIVEAHGGEVEVGKRKPRGLRVCLRLPLEQ